MEIGKLVGDCYNNLRRWWNLKLGMKEGKYIQRYFKRTLYRFFDLKVLSFSDFSGFSGYKKEVGWGGKMIGLFQQF